ncbi:hypothetical protein F6J84_06435 [Microbacterium caowuchunii]|uniref:hypothetical protein n=1 Tax=Microbacterium caowuchunii TaxID=2614638 RepID=UPI0012444EBA|nr:hypothetical protein [Microbacterium caowuchunii]QEV99767.1 hypothetical protein F6J84_06435 [Microbacterium caowuchunii]
MHTLAPRPTTVSVAFWIWLLSAIVGMVSVVNMLVAVNLLATMASTATEDLEPYFLLTGFGLIIGWVAVGAVVVQVILSVFFRDGANWARIVLTVIAVLSLTLVFSAPGEVFSWVYVVANAIAVACSFVPASNGYFAGSRRRRSTAQPVAA